jgi:glycosyltransferase involved in cell wall biosynthesis
LPFALLEAMTYNLPVVASDADAIVELVEHRLHCLIFRRSDRHDLLENLSWALNHPSQMQRLAENSQLRVQESNFQLFNDLKKNKYLNTRS